MKIKLFSLVLIALLLVSFDTSEELAGCKSSEEIELVINKAIYIGAPTYNSGNPLACYRIYEGAAYKIICLYGSKCKDSKNTLEKALEKCHESSSTAAEKAWVMRMAFDEILGVPTETKPIKKEKDKQKERGL